MGVHDLIQENKADVTHQALLASTPASLLAGVSGVENLSFPEAEKLIDSVVSRQQASIVNDELQGLLSGNAQSIRPGSNLDRHNRIERERLQKQGARSKAGIDQLLLDALNNGTLNEYIADQFLNASDEEIAATVAAIEDATGMPFDDYARTILGDDMPDRNPGENDADYHSRLLHDITEKVLDDEGKIKPQYADDRGVHTIVKDKLFTDVIDDIREIQANAQANEVSDDHHAAVRDASSPDYRSADTSGQVLETSALETTANDAQDNHRNNDATDETRIGRSSGFASRFRSNLSDSFDQAVDGAVTEKAQLEEVSTPAVPNTRIAEASTEARNEFSSAASPQKDAPENDRVSDPSLTRDV